jgi:hypothetical protein
MIQELLPGCVASEPSVMQRTAAFEIEKADTSAKTTSTVAGVKSERDIWASAGMPVAPSTSRFRGWEKGVSGMKPDPGQRLLESPLRYSPIQYGFRPTREESLLLLQFEKQSTLYFDVF